jgi:glycosyltransferase involved in cell wall biosynthesis
MNFDLSVITCSHNPRTDYLNQVLDALKGQTLDRLQWEYLLIDNASADQLESRVDLTWHPNARHIREGELGLTHARLRGIREAQGELLVFVDDDNVLASNYLAEAKRIDAEWPRLGAFGGQVTGAFDETPPAWTRKYWGRLVIREFEQDSWSNVPWLHETMPSGAGLCVRRSVATRYLEYHANGERRIIMDRAGDSLLSGGDTDLATTACDMGLGVGLFARLKVSHLIPPSRLSEDYLKKLVEGMAFSGIVLQSFRGEAQQPSSSVKTTIADQIRKVFMNRRDRRFFSAVRSGERRGMRFLANGHNN